MNDKKEIELRSEKVRNIIGQIPSRIVRVGITVIFVVVVGLVSGAYFFEFDNTIETTVKLSIQNNKIYYEAQIPYHKFKSIKEGQKVVVTINNNIKSTTYIQQLDSTLHIAKGRSYFKVSGIINEANIQLDEAIKAQTKIFTGKTNIINYILSH